MQVEDVAYIKNKEKIFAERKYFKETKTIFYDVTTKIQRILDAGRNEFNLDKNKFDPNAVFSNPIPAFSKEIKTNQIINSNNLLLNNQNNQIILKNEKEEENKEKLNLFANKLLEIQIECQGHDSEKQTDSREVTLTGFQRNFITGKTARFLIPVRDDKETGKGILESSINFQTSYTHPIIVITKALYGYLTDLSKVIDVTVTVQGMVNGRFLNIDRNIDLDKLFTNPCRGLQKKLKIDYVSRGFSGCIRIREKNDALVATIELGYPPVILDDDGDI